MGTGAATLVRPQKPPPFAHGILLFRVGDV
jgi:hypothetical protein